MIRRRTLVYIDAAAAAYSLLQLSRCSISICLHKTIFSYDLKNLAWACFLLDQVFLSSSLNPSL